VVWLTDWYKKSASGLNFGIKKCTRRFVMINHQSSINIPDPGSMAFNIPILGTRIKKQLPVRKGFRQVTVFGCHAYEKKIQWIIFEF